MFTKAKYSGMEVSEARRLKELDDGDRIPPDESNGGYQVFERDICEQMGLFYSSQTGRPSVGVVRHRAVQAQPAEPAISEVAICTT